MFLSANVWLIGVVNYFLQHLMNEWLSEKSEGNSKPSKSEPLEVTVEESMFVTCLPSPRNSMDRLRRNSQTSGVRERSSSVHGESNAGSAKKVKLQ